MELHKFSTFPYINMVTLWTFYRWSLTTSKIAVDHCNVLSHESYSTKEINSSVLSPFSCLLHNFRPWSSLSDFHFLLGP